MKRLKVLMIFLGMMLIFAGVASADQTLTFEGYPSYTVLTTQYAGIDFQGATVLLKSDNSLNWTEFPPHSGDAVIYNPSGPMQLVFSNPISYFSGYVTYNSGMEMDAYDSSNILLGSVFGAFSSNYVSTGNSPNEYLIITKPLITKVVLTGGGGNNFTLDDAQFSGSINNNVPEPATMLLLGFGLVGLAGVRRKFKK